MADGAFKVASVKPGVKWDKVATITSENRGCEKCFVNL